MKTYFYSIVLHAAALAPLLKTTTFSVTVSLAVCLHICLVFPDKSDRTFIDDGDHPRHNPWSKAIEAELGKVG